MKKFLVPTDFSETSKNAARYAAQMLSAVPGAELILYHVYEPVSVGADSSPLENDEDDRRLIFSSAVENVKAELPPTPGVQITTKAEAGDSLMETMRRFIRHNGVDMVIMGITGATRLAQVFMGSNTLKVINLGICPVMIVPPEANFTAIKNVAFCSDFKDVESTTPIAALRATLDIFKPNLHIINVDSDHYVELTEEYKAERAKLAVMLDGYNPEFYFMRFYDFLDAISQFSSDYQIDLLITVPKKHSFLSALYKTSHTRKLAYHSHVPVVAIHE